MRSGEREGARLRRHGRVVAWPCGGAAAVGGAKVRQGGRRAPRYARHSRALPQRPLRCPTAGIDVGSGALRRESA